MSSVITVRLLQALLCCEEIQLVNAYVGVTVVVHVEVVVEIEAILCLEVQDGKTELIEEFHALQSGYLALQLGVVEEIVATFIDFRAGRIVSACVPPEGQGTEDIDGGFRIDLTQFADAVIKSATLSGQFLLVEIVSLRIIRWCSRLSIVGVVVGTGPQDIDVVLACTIYLVDDGTLKTGESIPPMSVVGNVHVEVVAPHQFGCLTLLVDTEAASKDCYRLASILAEPAFLNHLIHKGRVYELAT